MKKFEYIIKRMKRTIRMGLSNADHDEKLMEILKDMGEKGWELKDMTVWTIATILVFCREKE